MANTTTASGESLDNAAAVEPLLWTIAEAADRVRLSYWAMYQLVKSGDIPSRYQGRRRYITDDDLNAYVANLPTERPKRAV